MTPHIFSGPRASTVKESNPYSIPTTEDNVRRPLISLNVLYDDIPGTKGCEHCEEVNGDDAYWCCSIINPSMYYIEFLNVWEKVQKWGIKKRLLIILRAIKTYLSNVDSKGCIFYDGKCLCYKQRPLSCRLYGVISQESWDKRTTLLKEQYEDHEVSDEFKRKLTQCPLVENKDGSTSIDGDTEQKWFQHTARCESRIGISPETILAHDGPQGSYRTFHDHIMLEFIDTEALRKLTEIKTTLPSDEDIESFAKILFDKIKENLL